MKIAMLGSANSPHIIKWANALSENNDVTVFSLPEEKDAHSEIVNKVSIEYLPVPYSQNGIIKNAKPLREKLAQGYDVVNAFGACTYGVLAAKAKAPKTVLTVLGHDIYADVDRGNKRLAVKSLKHADAVITATPNEATRIKSFYKKEIPIFTAPFGVDMERFKKTRTDGEENKMRFGSLKMLEFGNGVDLVIEAFQKYTDRSDNDAVLKIAGTGSMEKDLKEQARRLGIEDKVEFLGYVPNSQLPDVINTMDVTVQMPAAEAFGVCAVESMACEVPVVASDTIGASEYILNGVNGYLVKVGNTDRCCDCMIELENQALRDKMGAFARGDVSATYDLKGCVKKYEDALKSVG